jgi:nucleotide-binding universal stress UspA family protein
MQQSRPALHKHILIPIDGSELAESAAEYAIALARAAGATLTGLTVTPPYPTVAIEPRYLADSPELYRQRVASAAAKKLDRIRAKAVAAGVSCEMVHAEHDQPYQAIIGTANRQKCDLIVMASHGRRGTAAVVLGSETLKVLTHSTIPVLVYTPTTPHDTGALVLDLGQPVEITPR